MPTSSNGYSKVLPSCLPLRTCYLLFTVSVLLVSISPKGLAFNVGHTPSTRHVSSTMMSSSIAAGNEKKNNDLIGTVVILIPSLGDDIITSRISDLSSKTEGDALLSLRDAADAVSTKVGEMTNYAIDVSAVAIPESSLPASDIDLVRHTATNSDFLIGLGLKSPYDVRFLSMLFRDRRLNDDGELKNDGSQCQFALDCDKPFAPIVGPYDEANPFPPLKFPWMRESVGKDLMYRMMDKFEERTVQDYAEAILSFFEEYYGLQL